MIYLVIILIVSQIIHFIQFQIITSSLKRRFKNIDYQVRNLSQWNVSSQQALTTHLEQMNALVNKLYIKVRIDDLNMNYAKPSDMDDSTATFSNLMRAFNKEPIEKIRKEDIQQYYALLLQELQQLDNKISKVVKLPIPEPSISNAQLIKNEMNNRMNGNHWVNKNGSK